MDALRMQLAAATRMLVDEGIVGYSGHLSARVAGADSLLIQAVDDPRAGLDPDRMLLVGFDGAVLEGAGKPPSELAIHIGVYEARSDAGAVAHFHHDRTTMFSLVEGCPIVPVKNHASRWVHGVPVHPDASHISAPEQGRELAATLGAANAVLLRGHGEVVLAEDVLTLFADVLHFVENAEALAHAITLGRLRPLDEESLMRFGDSFDRSRHARKVWKYHTSVAASRGTIPAAWSEVPSVPTPAPAPR